MACKILYEGMEFQSEEEFMNYVHDNNITSILDAIDKGKPKQDDEDIKRNNIINQLDQLDHSKIVNVIKDALLQFKKIKKITSGKVTEKERQGINRLLTFLNDPTKLEKETLTYAIYLEDSVVFLKQYLHEADSIAKDDTLSPIEKATKLDYYYKFAESYKSMLDDFGRTISSTVDSPLLKTIQEINDYRTRIKNTYLKSMSPLVADILSDVNISSNKKAIALISEEIRVKDEAIRRRKASPKSDINDGRIKDLEAQLIVLQDFLINKVPTKEVIEKTLLGLDGDSSFMSMIFEATISNGDSVISSFAKYVKNKFHDLRNKMIPVQNKFQTEINDFAKATGREGIVSNNAKFNEGLFTVVDRLVNGKPQKYYALLGEFDESYIFTLQEHESKIEKLRNENKLDEMKAEMKALKDFKNKYMEQEYVEDYYKAYDLLIDDAKAAREKIFDEISANQKSAASMTQFNIDEIDRLWKEYKQMGYLNDKYGIPKKDNDLLIANSVIAFNNERRKMIYYEMDDKGLALFERIRKDKHDTLSPEDYKKWFRENTTRDIAPEWYEERDDIIKRISAILAAVPNTKDFTKEKEDIKDLWDRVFAIANSSRDEDKIPDGRALDIQQQKNVRDLNEIIEKIKATFSGDTSLSKAEKVELSALISKSKKANGELDGRKGHEGEMKYGIPLTKEEDERLNHLRNMLAAANQSKGKYLTKMQQIELSGLFTKLNNMQETVTTSYYKEIYDRELDILRNKTNFASEALLEEEFQKTEWYKNNHMLVSKWVQSETGRGGHYEQSYEPTYIWKEFRPSDEKYIIKDVPAFKYKSRIVKDEYKNDSFKRGNNKPKRMVDGSLSKFVNKKYEDLKNDTNPQSVAKYKYLKFLTDIYLESQEGSVNKMGLLLPAIEKGFIDRIQDNQIDAKYAKSKLSSVWEGVKRKFKANDQDADNDIVALGDLTGHEFSYVPTKFTGKIDIDNVSLNLSESILRFVYAAERTKMLNEAIPVASGLQNVLHENGTTIDKVDALGKSLGIFQKLKKVDTSTREKQITEFIKMVFYNESEKQEKLFGINITKLTSNLMHIGALNMLAGNIPSQVTNYISGYMQMAIESAGKEFYNKKNLFNGSKLYKSNTLNFAKDSFKLGNKSLYGQLFDLYDVEQGKYESHLGTKSDFSILKEMHSLPYIMKNAGEHEIAGSTMLAMMDAKIVKTKSGKDIKLVDAYHLVDGNLEVKPDVIFTDQDRKDFNNELHGVLRKLNGSYDKINRTWLEKWAVGRLFVFMRKWFVPLLINRWGARRFDNEVGRMTQGYYKTFWDTVCKDLYKMRLNVFENWKDYTPFERQQIMKTVVDVSSVAIMGLLIWLLGGYAGSDDDDSYKENSFITNHILYQLLRVKSETENFSPFGGINEMYRNISTPTVALSSIRNLLKASALAAEFISGNDVSYKRDYGYWKEGDNKLVALLSSMVGFKGTSFMPDTLIDNFSNSQHIR